MLSVKEVNIINCLEEVCKGKVEDISDLCIGNEDYVPWIEKAFTKYLQIRGAIPEEFIPCIGCPATRRNFEHDNKTISGTECWNDEQEGCQDGPERCAIASEYIDDVLGGAYYYLIELVRMMEG